MDKKLKKTAIVIFLTSFIGQMALLIYLAGIDRAFRWQLITGGSLFIFGLSAIYILFAMKKKEFRGKELLFYGILLNPGLMSVFLGLAIIARQYQLNFIESVAVIIMVVCLIAGFSTLIAFFLRKNRSM